MWFSLSHSLWRPSFSRKRARPRRPARARLAFEVLEDRTVPSVLGGAGDSLPSPVRPGADVVSADPNDWPMYNHDVSGTRFNSSEHLLGPHNVAGLQVQWTFPTKAVVS